jgi:hypothetical protein
MNMARAAPPVSGELLPLERREDIAPQDWDILFDAVKARLRLSATVSLDAVIDAESQAQLKTAVLECVGALDQLQASVGHWIDRYALHDEIARLTVLREQNSQHCDGMDFRQVL